MQRPLILNEERKILVEVRVAVAAREERHRGRHAVRERVGDWQAVDIVCAVDGVPGDVAANECEPRLQIVRAGDI